MRTLTQLSPYVRLAHDFHSPPGLSLSRRRINDHALLYFREGRGWFQIGSTSLPITAGTVFIIRPDVVHSFACPEPAVHMLNLHFDLVQHPGCERVRYHRPTGTRNPRRRVEMLSTDPGAEDFLPWIMKVAHAATYERLFRVILAAHRLSDAASQLAVKAALLDLLSLLFRQARGAAVFARSSENLPQLERAAQFMATHVNRPLTLQEMAGAAALSRSRFASAFRAYYHIAPAKFHLRQRIETAATELILGRRSVKELATVFGFQSVHHFTRCFARLMGEPPGAYRRSHGSFIENASASPLPILRPDE